MDDAKVIPLSPDPSAATLRGRSDDDLMALAAASHQDAFEQLVQRHMAQLMRYCSKQVYDPRRGEEIAQDTWLQVWSYRDRYQAQGKFRVFLYTTARNRCRSQARNTSRKSKWFSDLQAPVETTSGDDAGQLDLLIKNEQARRVQDAIAYLPPKFREAVLLKYDQDLDYSEIAEIVGRSESTVRSRIFHGLKKLRKQVIGGER